MGIGGIETKKTREMNAAPEYLVPENWKPLPHQLPLWRYLERSFDTEEIIRAMAIWHRRAGKDDVGLRFMALSAWFKPATYWYMLPMQRQARRVIWEAINPATGLKRIDEAFPSWMRAKTHENEMSIHMKSGSMIHMLGSDNYNSLVGSPPYGIVFSEWALSKPASWGFIRPILRQNHGWALFITTPRGRNHAHRMYEAARAHPEKWFSELLTAEETNVFSPQELTSELAEYIDDFGIEDGTALFEQEYLCSFESAIRGSYWGAEMIRAMNEGRIAPVKPLAGLPIHTAWDIGVDNATSIWFFQVTANEVRWLYYIEQVGMGVEWFATKKWQLGQENGWSYDGSIDYVPHDARQRSWTSTNIDGTARQRLEDMKANKLNPVLVPNHSRQDGINAARKTIGRSLFDEEGTKEGRECLSNYQRLWDADRRVYARTPFHNWAVNGADAFRYGSVAWRGIQKPKEIEVGRHVVSADSVGKMRTNLTFNELRDRNAKRGVDPGAPADKDGLHLPIAALGRTFNEMRDKNAKRKRLTRTL